MNPIASLAVLVMWTLLVSGAREAAAINCAAVMLKIAELLSGLR